MDKGLYIHIPFCKSKCLYCDFYSCSSSENLMIDYSRALAEEINSIGDIKIKTIFIGGGTPTYLSLDAMNVLSKGIKNLNKCKDLEFTIEGNPGTFTMEKLKLYKDMGANRLSIGLQAAQNNLLKTLGRIHSSQDFKEAVNMGRKAGFNNINVDLIFGIPGQSLDDWKETLNLVADLNLDHISAYSLIIEEGTEFYRMNNEGKLQLPDEDLEREMYSYVVGFLKEKGYIHYEISNFAKIGMECRHNFIYWNMEEYFGIGAAAHSYIDGKRYSNQCSIEGYINGQEIKDIHVNSLEDDMSEFMFLGLRKIDGISIDKFNKRFKINIFDVYGKVIDKYINLGLMLLEGDSLRLSIEGIQLSNTVMCDFVF